MQDTLDVWEIFAIVEVWKAISPDDPIYLFLCLALYLRV
jgi:hypothetical protein